jgi:hypothetical protein
MVKMRGLFASLVVAIVFMLIALVATGVGALGVAVVGLLLHRWFDLTQWQGSLIALVMAAGLTVVIYQLAHQPAPAPTWTDDWEDEDEEEEEEEEPEEPPIVPWRRSRPTPGELPADKSAAGGSKFDRSSRTRR